ncbi:MAG: biosynthetic-type acetolactate synthase large subunit [Arenicella sp.]
MAIKNKTCLGSSAVLECLVAEGVDTIFGYPGGAIMPVYDALYDYADQLTHILARHEQGAIHAAEGYARINRAPAVCMATSGPGATNLLTGLYDALLDSTPLVAITGQVADHLLGSDAFQESDIIGASSPLTKWNYQITDARDIPAVMRKAFYVASTGKPGPVLIDITKNAQIQEFELNYESLKENPIVDVRSYRPRPKVKAESITAAAQLINSAKQPLILAGHGIHIAGAQAVFQEFVEKAGIPVATTFHGLSCLSAEHPLSIGLLGMHGNYGPNLLSNDADVVIAIGMRFDDRVTGDITRYLPNSKVIHIEIDKSEIDKNVPTTVAIHADAKQALEALLPQVEQRQYPHWLQQFTDCWDKEHDKVIKGCLAPNESGSIKMPQVIRMLSDKTDGQGVIVTDVGQHQMVAMRYYQFKTADAWISSGGSGTMGFGLPAAFGAKLADKERQVYMVVGDGGFQMTIQELGMLSQWNVPVKILLLDNNYLGMVRQWQELFFDNRYSQVALTNPDFLKIAEGFGVPGEEVRNYDDLSAALDRTIEATGPYLLHVRVDKEENVFPMIATGKSVAEVALDAEG